MTPIVVVRKSRNNMGVIPNWQKTPISPYNAVCRFLGYIYRLTPNPPSTLLLSFANSDFLDVFPNQFRILPVRLIDDSQFYLSSFHFMYHHC